MIKLVKKNEEKTLNLSRWKEDKRKREKLEK